MEDIEHKGSWCWEMKEEERTSKTKTASVEQNKPSIWKQWQLQQRPFFHAATKKTTETGRDNEEEGNHELFVPVANGENC